MSRRSIRLHIPNMAREIATKTDAQIERETALKWAGRAVAACRRVLAAGKKGEVGEAMDVYACAVMYRHEALEHAASVGDNGRTLNALQRQLDKAMLRAFGAKR